MHLLVDQRLRHAVGGHNRHLQAALGDRAAVQANQAELPAALLLWRKCQRHQDTDMGDAHRQSAADHHATIPQQAVELLQSCHHGAYHAHVLRGLPQLFREPGKGLGEDAAGIRRTTAAAETRILGGAWFYQSESVTLIYSWLPPQKMYFPFLADSNNMECVSQPPTHRILAEVWFESDTHPAVGGTPYLAVLF